MHLPQSEYEPVDKSPERIRRMFDEISPRYDLLNHLLSGGIDVSWRRQMVREVFSLLMPLGGRTISAPILDVATGTGDLAFELYRGLSRRKIACGRFSKPIFQQSSILQVPYFKEDAGGTPAFPVGFENRPCETLGPCILGVDFSPNMLAVAQKKCERKKLSSAIHFEEADGLNLPFESNQFSAVTIAFGLRNMNDVQRGIEELIRVCRPLGVVAILEFTLPTVPLYATIYRWYFQKILPLIGYVVSGRNNRAYQYLPQSVLEFDDREQMKNRFIAAGLTDVRALSMTFGTATLYQGRKN